MKKKRKENILCRQSRNKVNAGSVRFLKPKTQVLFNREYILYETFELVTKILKKFSKSRYETTDNLAGKHLHSQFSQPSN